MKSTTEKGTSAQTFLTDDIFETGACRVKSTLPFWVKVVHLKSVHFKKPVMRSSFLSKSVVIFNITTTNMKTLFEGNENRVTGFLK